MSIFSLIRGQNDLDHETQAVRVGKERNLAVELHPPDPPPEGQLSRLRYYSGLLGSTGKDSGTTNMVVNATAAAPQRFYVTGEDDFDICVTRLIVFIGDGSVTHAQFGGISGLTNGWTLRAIEGGQATNIINVAKTNGNVIIQSATSLAWGDSATAFELSNYSGTQDAVVVVIDLERAIPGQGIRLGRGTEDRIESVVQDDLTALNDFTVRAIGYRWYP